MIKFVIYLYSALALAQPSPSNDKVIYFNAWAGSEKTNQYIRTQSDIFEKKTGIKVVHVKVADTQATIKTIESEKTAGNLKSGKVDVLWVNGENFAKLKKQNLLYGPITDKLSNVKNIDIQDHNFQYDFNIPTEGFEAPWGKAQFVFIWSPKKTKTIPTTAQEFLEYAKKNPGKISYVKPPQFHGTTFLKQVLLDLSPDLKVFQKDCAGVDLAQLSLPLWNYLNQLHPFLWRKGQTFPLSVEKMHQMLLDGELDVSMSFNPLDSESLVLKKEIPADSVSVTFQKGGIGNVHFLAIPFNSPHQKNALLWIDHLLSVEAQAAKTDIKIWGDPSVLDRTKLSEKEKENFSSKTSKGALLAEPHACWVDYLQNEWIKKYGSGLKN